MYKICLRNVTLGTHEPLYNNVRFGLSISVWYSEIFSTEMWTSSAENAQTYHDRLWISSQACDSIVTTWVNSGFHTKKTYLNTKETKIPRHGKPEGSVSDVCALSQDIGQPKDKKNPNNFRQSHCNSRNTCTHATWPPTNTCIRA